MDAVFIVALAHPLDAAGKLRDRPGQMRETSPASTSTAVNCRKMNTMRSRTEISESTVSCVRRSSAPFAARPPPAATQSSRPTARNIAPGPARPARTAPCVCPRRPAGGAVIRVPFAAQNGRTSPAPASVPPLAERVYVLPTICVHKQRRPPSLSGRLQKHDETHRREYAPLLFRPARQRGFRLRRVTANRA